MVPRNRSAANGRVGHNQHLHVPPALLFCLHCRPHLARELASHIACGPVLADQGLVPERAAEGGRAGPYNLRVARPFGARLVDGPNSARRRRNLVVPALDGAAALLDPPTSVTPEAKFSPTIGKDATSFSR
eukprot:CAMPEP_0183396226 /NCGR_PEP_ID=MMETSP0370-20130417/9884_1 /TAXON_ID=268820 /ORGANISM="Peridinium aciculiferum, Strain PAER-2" /LENGTH=130 /DNA_ID=CAMNT_0025576989 /DNA_START=103 /DNA_END=496 /DNA_ORIENTATION=-